MLAIRFQRLRHTLAALAGEWRDRALARPLTLGRYLEAGGRLTSSRRIPDGWRTIPRRLWQYQPKPRRLWLSRDPESTRDLALLPPPGSRGELRRRLLAAGLPSTAIHIVAGLWLLLLPAGRVDFQDEEFARIGLRYPDATPLVAPPPELLRRLSGNQAPAVREITLEQLAARPGAAPPAPSAAPAAGEPQPFVPPPAEQPKPAAPAPLPEPPPVEIAASTAPQPPATIRTPALSLPPPPSAGKPRIAFEEPGTGAFSPAQTAGLSRAPVGPGAGTAIPKPAGSSVEAAIQELSRAGGGGHGLVIGDLESKGGIFEARELPPSRDGSASNLELLSDPKGVDFRPYLIQVLSSVRRNWHAVMPASAKLGRRGKVIIQFAIDRSGGVPKLVIAVPSGADPLDRAAVAAISASNPFPPLPPEYTANDIRLQLNFLYNLK